MSSKGKKSDKKCATEKCAESKCATKKSAEVKCTTAKCAEAKCATVKCEEVKKPLKKDQIITELARLTGVSKKDVAQVIDNLGTVIGASLAPEGAGSFTLPGLLKITKKIVPAKPEQKSVPNPFRQGELMDRPAKPAHQKIQVSALKALKDMA